MNTTKFYNSKGEVAVLVAPGYGAGWYSWNTEYEDCLFDPEIVQMVLTKANAEDVKKAAELKWPDGYWNAAHDLGVCFIKEGVIFRVDEYDGYESIVVNDSEDWHHA